MSPCTPRPANARRGICPGRAPRKLRWATFEAAKCAARRGSPDYPYYQRLAARPDSGKILTLAVERKILRCSYHTLRELGDAALAMPVPEAKGVAA
jgi:transposase